MNDTFLESFIIAFFLYNISMVYNNKLLIFIFIRFLKIPFEHIICWQKIAQHFVKDIVPEKALHY